MKFKYRKLDLPAPFSRTQKLQRPIIPISFSNGVISIRYEALIDSGADFSILPAGLAEIFNISLKKCKRIYFTAATGEITEGYISKLNIDLDGKVISTNVVFANLPKNVGILGQYGFFDKFKVSFDLNKKEMEFRERK